MFHFSSIVPLIINLVLWILFILLGLPIIFLLFCYKCFILFVALKVFKNLHPISPTDVFFALPPKLSQCVNVSQIWKVDGIIDLKTFQAHFSSLFLSCPESRTNCLNLYCYLESFGGYVFKKSVNEINIDEHIKVHTLPSGVLLETFISKWKMEEKYAKLTPLWEIVLVYDEEIQETTILFKMHHALGDGYGNIHIIGKLTGNEAPYSVQDEKETIFHMVKGTFFAPLFLLQAIIGTNFSKNTFHTLRNNAITPCWYTSLGSLDLEKIKFIRRKTNVKFASVMMSITIGALRKYLAEEATSKELPQKIYTANSLPWPNHPRTILVNHMTLGMVQVPLKTNDPLRRLHETDTSFQQFQDNYLPKFFKRFALPIAWCVPSYLLTIHEPIDFKLKCSNFFASLPLSPEPHFLLGKRVKHLYMPAGIKDAAPNNLVYTVSSSHSGLLDMSIIASSQLIKDQTALDVIINTYLPEELNLLYSIVKQ